MLFPLHLPSRLRESYSSLPIATSFHAQNSASCADTPVHQHSPKFRANLSWVPRQKGRMPHASTGQSPLPLPRWPVPPPHGPPNHCNVVWWRWHRPGCSELPLLARESLPFRLWQDSVLSRNALTPEGQRGTRAGTRKGEFDSSYLSKSQDTGISDKGKICLERHSATQCLILVFWCFRYRNSFHLFTALHSHRFITSLSTRAHSVKHQLSA